MVRRELDTETDASLQAFPSSSSNSVVFYREPSGESASRVSNSIASASVNVAMPFLSESLSDRALPFFATHSFWR